MDDIALTSGSWADEAGCLTGQPARIEAAQINLRHLRVFASVASRGSMQSAASDLNASRSSVTKIIQKLEKQIGSTLFQRTSTGLVLSGEGRVLSAIASRALRHLEEAEERMAQGADGTQSRRRFVHNLTSSQLQAFLSVISHKTHTAAALQLQVTQPAITMALRDLQSVVGCPLLQRDPQGITPNRQGMILADGLNRALRELEDLHKLLQPERCERTERVVVGVLPLAGTYVPARAVEAFLNSHPDANLTLVEGPYATLLRDLRAGEIDVIIGGLAAASSEPDIAQQQLYYEEIRAAVRTSHPLAARELATFDHFLKYKWVLPRHNTPARSSLERLLHDQKVSMPGAVIETNSVLTTRSLLMEGDSVAFITRSQVRVDEIAGILRTIGLDVPHPRVPVGVRVRVGFRPSSLIKDFLWQLQMTGVEYTKMLH